MNHYYLWGIKSTSKWLTFTKASVYKKWPLPFISNPPSTSSWPWISIERPTGFWEADSIPHPKEIMWLGYPNHCIPFPSLFDWLRKRHVTKPAPADSISEFLRPGTKKLFLSMDLSRAPGASGRMLGPAGSTTTTPRIKPTLGSRAKKSMQQREGSMTVFFKFRTKFHIKLNLLLFKCIEQKSHFFSQFLLLANKIELT